MKNPPDRCEAAPESRLAALQKAGSGLLLLMLAGLRFLYLHLTPWGLYNFSGLRHIIEMHWPRRPNAPGYEKPPTLVLWLVGIYVGLYGIAATYYESSLDRVENRMGALVSQLATANDQSFKQLIEQIPRIQRMETPPEPSLLSWEGNFLLASFLGKQQNPEIMRWARDTIEDWKDRGLANINFDGVDLSGAELDGINFSEAGLWKANLSAAQLGYANLSRAWLWEADLSGTQLSGANLSGARLKEANLSGAQLEGANLSGADLWGANLFGARLRDANFSGANLGDIENWQAIESIDNANIIGVKNAPKGFREWALKNGAVELEPAAWEAFRKKPTWRWRKTE